MPKIYYAGVGSRSTPKPTLELMKRIASCLRQQGYTLRSGGADGADTAFWSGAVPNVEVHVPNEAKKAVWPSGVLPSKKAYALASKFHPSWKGLSEYAKLLHARNVGIVLGVDLETPADFVLCWTPDGATTTTTEATGGTGMAIRVAYAHGIPVYNLQNPETAQEWQNAAATILRGRDEAQRQD